MAVLSWGASPSAVMVSPAPGRMPVMLFVLMMSSVSIPSGAVGVPTDHNRKMVAGQTAEREGSNMRPLERPVGTLFHVVFVRVGRGVALGLSERALVGERLEILPNCPVSDMDSVVV